MTELWQLSACEAVDLLRTGKVSPTELVHAAAARIAAVEPALNALPTLCIERALEHAKRIERSPPADPPPHYLHGLPIAVKDNVAVAGVRCTHASPIFRDNVAAASDLVVQRLEANGAIVVAKSNLPEFAAGGVTYNEVFGTTLNPWNTAVTPGGSSGGSAAALAAGEVWLATGNDFGGSIRIPASFCGLAGLRPSPGRVARIQRQPTNPFSVEGPMARNVADCALMFDCEVGDDPLDPLSLPAPARSFSAAVADPVRPARVAWSPDLGIAPAIDREVVEICRAAALRLADLGAIVEEGAPQIKDAPEVFLTLRSVVFVARFGEHMRQRRHQLKPDIIQNTERGLALSAEDVVRAEIAHGEMVRRVARFFERYDLLVCPAVLCPPLPKDQRYLTQLEGVRFDDYQQWLVMTWAITATLCPAMSIPCGFTRSGLPVGLQVVAPPRAEAKLLGAARLMEELYGLARRLPIDPIMAAPATGSAGSTQT